MMDFIHIKEKPLKSGVVEVYPDFLVQRSKDLMVRGKSFYAIWDAQANIWSTDEYDVQRLVDEALRDYKEKLSSRTSADIRVKFMSAFSSSLWLRYRRYLANVSDNSHQLDNRVCYLSDSVKRRDYISKRLPYDLHDGETPAYDELMGVLYDPQELEKLEWAIGSILAGESRNIQKFVVIYGAGGTGKSTFLNLLQSLFEGYYTVFDARELTGNNNVFATEVFRGNPLVAIQHDGDLSRIINSGKLNSLISHELIVMNEKFKPSYTARANAFLFLATNKPVHVSDSMSGIIRRLVDVRPSGRLIPSKRYRSLVGQMRFELGAIAKKALECFNRLGADWLDGYRPLSMIQRTDVFYNFVVSYRPTFEMHDGVTLTQAYKMYKMYMDESNLKPLPRYKFRDELKNYFREFLPVTRVNGHQVRSYFRDVRREMFIKKVKSDKSLSDSSWLSLSAQPSLLDIVLRDMPAQYANEETGKPIARWSTVKERLRELDTTKTHYVLVKPITHIVIDFDLKVEGKKVLDKNIERARSWKPTYAETSQSGKGLHLHYYYTGDPAQLSSLFEHDVEIKTFSGLSSLRRRVFLVNNIAIATLNPGDLPRKEHKTVLNFKSAHSERALRHLIERNLNKEIHNSTKSSIDFIYKLLSDAKKEELRYDLRDIRARVLEFALHSTHQARYCVKVVSKMPFHSENEPLITNYKKSGELVFFDLEVFPNLLLVSWKYPGHDNACIHMINPTPQMVERFLRMRLVGYNCRRYDNHILYARYLGYSLAEIYSISQDIIVNKTRTRFFREAYGLSYADVYDFLTKRQSLKLWEIELGLVHDELAISFDEPVPDEMIDRVSAYCDADVRATEAVFNARHDDFMARQMLAALSGLRVNDTTRRHVAEIVFGRDRQPQTSFVYTDLSIDFPGYSFDRGKSSYRGENPGEGGYVYSVPGFYKNVYLLDIASMHPTSIGLLNLFGPYTERYLELLRARLAIKRGHIERARTMLDGAFSDLLTDVKDFKTLAYALKLAINIVYGLTSAKFPNRFRDLRNVDNIVAKRGALFMIDLKHAVTELGYVVAHIKTDSIKVPDADKKLHDFVVDFGKKYGYDFELEAVYDRLCLVNDAVYVAHVKGGGWTTTGAEFAHPYIFKTLFSGEDVTIDDLTEVRTVTTALYLDYNEALPETEHQYSFIGRVGAFLPVLPGRGGGLLLRRKKEDYHAVSRTKGYRWVERSIFERNYVEDDIDYTYYKKLASAARDHISLFVDFTEFIKGD